MCAAHNTSPLRSAAEVRERPERTAHLLAALMMHASAVCIPRTAGRSAIKPRSALAYPIAIVRIFGRWGIALPSFKLLRSALAYLSRLYIAHHGPASLAPRRAEPMKYTMVLAMYAIAQGTHVGGREWSDADHDIFMLRRLICVLWPTAFRLAEIVAHTSGEIMYLMLCSLVWSIGGVLITRPTVAMLRALRPGIDYARLTPPRSKPDQWGEIHCPHAVTLTYRDEPGNAAAALRDIELRVADRGLDREQVPLFHDSAFQPYNHSRLNRLLRLALARLYGEAVARLYTFHSFRSGLATALHAAGVSGDMIMLICRWMCAESLMVYRRRGTAEHEINTQKAMRARVDTIQPLNVPSVVGDQRYAELNEWSGGSRESKDDYEKALKAALDAALEGKHAPATPSGDAPAALVAAPTAAAGDAVVVRHEAWPNERCAELGGSGWAVSIISLTAHTARVRFTHAKAADGRTYEDARVPRAFIAKLAAGEAEASA